MKTFFGHLGYADGDDVSRSVGWPLLKLSFNDDLPV